MSRNMTFTLRVDARERASIDRLARERRRSRSDVLRQLVWEALQEHSFNAATAERNMKDAPVQPPKRPQDKSGAAQFSLAGRHSVQNRFGPGEHS